jgi:hypothetical protein
MNNGLLHKNESGARIIPVRMVAHNLARGHVSRQPGLLGEDKRANRRHAARLRWRNAPWRAALLYGALGWLACLAIAAVALWIWN